MKKLVMTAAEMVENNVMSVMVKGELIVMNAAEMDLLLVVTAREVVRAKDLMVSPKNVTRVGLQVR